MMIASPLMLTDTHKQQPDHSPAMLHTSPEPGSRLTKWSEHRLRRASWCWCLRRHESFTSFNVKLRRWRWPWAWQLFCQRLKGNHIEFHNSQLTVWHLFILIMVQGRCGPGSGKVTPMSLLEPGLGVRVIKATKNQYLDRHTHPHRPRPDQCLTLAS